MFWADTTPQRCADAAGELAGYVNFGGQDWTVWKYGDEIIVTLDGPGGHGTCARQTSGTIDILAGLNALKGLGLLTGDTLSQVNTGWEVTYSEGKTFKMNDLWYEVVPK